MNGSFVQGILYAFDLFANFDGRNLINLAGHFFTLTDVGCQHLFEELFIMHELFGWLRHRLKESDSVGSQR